uniref:Coiled-coil domain-containing protein 24 n=1 Tax=Leptobrachium leishanense TaxID=445787 RepID=A0A8C5R369_9ANUR
MLQPIGDQDSGYGELTEPPLSLWKLVEEQVPVSERAEIKRILGDAAVDLSLELHAETGGALAHCICYSSAAPVEVLLDLWRDLRATYTWLRPSSPGSLSSLLADPPAIKDMVTQEIRMLLLSVRQEARRGGLDESQVLSKYNPKIVSYVMAERRPESSASSQCTVQPRSHGTSSSCSMRSTYHGLSRPQTAGTGREGRPLSSLSTGSSIEDDLEELKDKLQISHIDDVIAHLKSLLEEECRTLERDVAGLQQRLELEHLYSTGRPAPLPEPSLSELKEERRVIKRDLQQSAAASSAKSMTCKTEKNRPSDVPERTLSDSHVSVSSATSAKAPPIRPSSSNSKLKIREQNLSVGNLLPAALAPHHKVTEKKTSARGAESTDSSTSRASHRPFKAHLPGNVPVLCPSNDLHKSTAPVLNAASGKDSLSNLFLSQESPCPPEPRVPQQAGDSVYVPSPPQIQRPAGSTGSFSSLRRARVQRSISRS